MIVLLTARAGGRLSKHGEDIMRVTCLRWLVGPSLFELGSRGRRRAGTRTERRKVGVHSYAGRVGRKVR